MLKLKKCGFTLAEVLITLAIIGVVAALTIPTVMRNIRDQQLKTQFKKVYSTINQTITKTYADLGYQADCYYTIKGGVERRKDCQNLFWPQFFKNLKVIKDCANNAYANGCSPKYRGREAIYQERQTAKEGEEGYDPDYGMNAIKGCAAWTSDNMNIHAPVYVLADGTIFIFAYSTLRDHVPDFAVDINGAKAPNKFGYDIFAFHLQTYNEMSTQVKLTEGYCFTAEKGGRTTTEMIKETMTK